MSMFDSVFNYLADAIASRIKISTEVSKNSIEYREGRHPEQLKVKPGQANDNLAVNFSGLIVDRSVSQVMGNEIQIDLPGESDSPEQQYIETVLELNKSNILFHDALITASDVGYGVIKTVKDGLIGKDGKLYPRLIVLNPAFVTWETAVEDDDLIVKYINQYKIEIAGKEVARREITELSENGDNWIITMHEYIGNKWVQVGDVVVWEYQFPPMITWKNLPNPYSLKGRPDLTEDVREMQDRVNYLSSNISKIIRYYAHPMRWGKNLGNYVNIETGPDKMLIVGDDGEITQLEQLGDLTGAMKYLQWVRQSLFDITRSVDIDSLQDKLGSLTNFGLRVLYTDSLSKIKTKRALFGEMLLELTTRLLIMGRYANTDPGSIIWDDPIPQNEAEQMEMLDKQITLGLVSKETASTELGRVWSTKGGDGEKGKIEAEQEEARLQEDSVGGELFRRFINGQGA